MDELRTLPAAFQRTSDIEGHAQGVCRRHRSPTEDLTEILSLDQLHSDVVTAIRLTGCINADQVRVAQAGGDARFTLETADELGISFERGRQDFQGDLPV